MEDCTITTETIDNVHYTYYNKDCVSISECRRSKKFGLNLECWYCGDKLHRDDGPAKIFSEKGQIVQEIWYRDGKRHREDGPAMTHYRNGQIYEETWYRHGKWHREDGPATIYYKKGQKIEERWYRDDKLYPIGQLAMVVYQNIDSECEYFTGIIYAPNTDKVLGTLYVRNIDEFRDAVKGDAIHDVLRPLPIPIQQAIIPHYCYQ